MKNAGAQRTPPSVGIGPQKALADDADWSEVGEEYKGKHLCSECAPKHYKDGKPTGFGKWHGHFPKEPYDGSN